MKIKKSNLEWYVLRYDFNKRQVVNYNVMSGIAELVVKKVKSGAIHNKETLREFLKREFMHDYWCRTEYEILVSDLGSVLTTNAEKIDVWRQLEMNLDRIVEYVNTRCDLKLN